MHPPLLCAPLMCPCACNQQYGTTTWQMLTDSNASESQKACIFCGVLDASNRRSLFMQDVCKLLEEQQRSGAAEPVNTCMTNIIKHAAENYVQQEDGSEPLVNTCMCCYHWVARRQAHRFVRFPLQNLFWYTKTLDLNKRRNYDARILHRLATALISPQGSACLQNYYATLFFEEELALFKAVAEAPVAELHLLFARHYYAQNGESLFLPDARITDAVRSATRAAWQVSFDAVTDGIV